jgi:anti-anti-sigma factor
MECDIEASDDTTAVLRLSGRLDLLTATRLRSVVDEQVAAGRTTIVVDLGALEFMDSSGLGALVAGLKTTRQADGDLRIAAPTDQVREVLELTQLHRVLRPHANVEAALSGA